MKEVVEHDSTTLWHWIFLCGLGATALTLAWAGAGWSLGSLAMVVLGIACPIGLWVMMRPEELPPPAATMKTEGEQPHLTEVQEPQKHELSR